MNSVQQLKQWINNSQSIVAITGAGFSTESGIPDFRGNTGVYKNPKNYGFPPETIVSNDFFYAHTDIFYSFCKNELVHREAMPNRGHKALYDLEKSGKLSAVITQNIDGLHQKAGNSNVFELHGTVWDYYCISCNKYHSLDYVMDECEGVPKCKSCDNILKPDAVLFGEMLNPKRFIPAQKYISKADLLLVAGTSLNVKTAGHLINFFKGRHLVIINETPTDYDESADLVIHDKIGNIVKLLSL